MKERLKEKEELDKLADQKQEKEEVKQKEEAEKFI